MDSIHILTLKTATAVGRLADLQRRADHTPEKAAPMIKPALRELSTALEELQVANEHLQTQVDELASARWSAASVEKRLDEFTNLVPLPCVWTDVAGVLADGNEAACALLNISKQRLAGKPFMLFVSDREALFAALRTLGEGGTPVVEVDVVVRPRERRPRKLRLRGCHLQHDLRCVWFLLEPALAVPAPE
jgi:PAS domain-containing protein